jgi:hypothetical protein
MGPESTAESVSRSAVESDESAVVAEGWDAEAEIDASRPRWGGVIVPVASAVLTVTTAPADGVCDNSSFGLPEDNAAETLR